MAANTGPNLNTYIIPEVELGDTFNVWRDTTNTQTFKLNKLKVYDGVSSSSITLTLSEGGTFQAQIADNVGKGVTFAQPVVFSSGVTFNGDVTFNAQTFTVNANNVTIDDYSLVLGATGPSTNNDNTINAAGGGGLLLNRGTGGDTAAWLWRATRVQGLTGVWGSNAHIGLCGASAGLYPNNGGVLPIHGTGVRLDGNADGAHGLQVDLTNGTGVNSVVSLLRYAPAGSTVFAEVLNGTTYGSRPFLNVKDGANRKTIRQTSHNLLFGMPVRLNSGTYVAARADTAENAEVIGIVSAVFDTHNFELTFIGEIFGNFSEVLTDQVGGNLAVGSTYYLSPGQLGKITPVQPLTAGNVHKAVLIATGNQSAVVLPFTGGLLTSSLTISTSSSVATRIKQINNFKKGDIVRFAKGARTLNYGSGTLTQTYSDGAYVRSQANTAVEGEVAGMVIGVDIPVRDGSNNIVGYREFDVLMDGWFDGLSGLDSGDQYFLNINCLGANNAFESNSFSYSKQIPNLDGSIRKPLFMATSSTSGYLYSYRGDQVVTSAGVSIDITNSLISDLRAGISGDLDISVYNEGSVPGHKSITIATGNAGSFTSSKGSKRGNVGIGDTNYTNFSSTNNGNRILAPLDLTGWMRVGSTFTSPIGQDLIVMRDTGQDVPNGLTASSRVVIGSDHSTGNLVIGWGVRPNRTTSNAYISSLTGTHDRSALVIGTDGTSPALMWRAADNSNVALDGTVALTEVLKVTNAATTITGNLTVDTNTLFVDAANDRVGIAKTPTTTLDVNGTISGTALALSAKATSAATVSGDAATTLTTKGYVDGSTGAAYAVNPGGLKVKFGKHSRTNSTANTSTTVTFDSTSAFTSIPYVVATLESVVGTIDISPLPVIVVHNITTTGFSVNANRNNIGNVNWIAIGY